MARALATYKTTLALCLMRFAEQGETQVTMNELAQAFFHEYRQRLTNGLPQLSNPACKTLLERAVETYQHSDLTNTAATLRVEREGFSDVVPRFQRSTETLSRSAFTSNGEDSSPVSTLRQEKF